MDFYNACAHLTLGEGWLFVGEEEIVQPGYEYWNRLSYEWSLSSPYVHGKIAGEETIYRKRIKEPKWTPIVEGQCSIFILDSSS